jgi:hypothetical protein
MLKVRLAAIFLGLAMISSLVLQAQTGAAPSAPIPSQILTAKKVFISNNGDGYDFNIWSGGQDRTYNEFYAAMKSAGPFEIVSAPGDADLVLEVYVIANSDIWEFKMSVLDPKTRIVLWTKYERLKSTFSKTERDKNFDDTINKLVSDLRALVAQPAVVSNPK